MGLWRKRTHELLVLFRPIKNSQLSLESPILLSGRSVQEEHLKEVWVGAAKASNPKLLVRKKTCISLLCL